MEEASLDHGFDRLRFSFVYFLLFLFAPLASASTFGPNSVVNQAQNAQYIVRGRVLGVGWAELEPQLKRPYTHWKLQVLEQTQGNSLGAQLLMRSPGGEIGDLGYHVAGSATFAPGEEVFVVLRDTDERDTKEIVGLASGKYRVERSGNQSQVVSGLGFTVKGTNGQALSVEDFSALLRRVAQHQDTEDDQNIFVNKTSVHDEETTLPPPLLAQAQEEARTLAASHKPDTNSSVSPPNPAQDPGQNSEESSKGSSAGPWITAVVALLAFVGIGLLLFFRR